MNARAVAIVLFALALIDGSARTAQPLSDGEQAAAKEKPKQPDKDKEKKPVEPPTTDIFSQAPLMGPQFATGFNPHMMGDFPGTFAHRSFTVVGSQTIANTAIIRDPIAIAFGNGINPIIITTTVPHGLVTGNRVSISGVPGFQAANGQFVITVLDATRFLLNGTKNPGLGTGGTATSATTTTTTTPVTQTRTVLSLAFAAGSIKVADNESPRPQDRVFFTYNFFGHIQPPADQPSGGASNVLTTSGAGQFTSQTVTSTTFPNAPRVTANLHREVFGFEKTFLDGNASIEMRLPVLQLHGNPDAFSARDIGDLTILGKYALINNRETGNVFTVGLAVTAPTGPSVPTIDGNLHSTYLQPWFGYIWNSERFYLHAFHSLVVPTDSRDITLLFNDVGLNYWLYRASSERPLRYIVPMIEAHVTTPLNHRDMDGPVYVPDLVVLTGGVHFGLFRNASLSVGVATPVTGPRLFGVEAFTQLNWRF